MEGQEMRRVRRSRVRMFLDFLRFERELKEYEAEQQEMREATSYSDWEGMEGVVTGQSASSSVQGLFPEHPVYSHNALPSAFVGGHSVTYSQYSYSDYRPWIPSGLPAAQSFAEQILSNQSIQQYRNRFSSFLNGFEEAEGQGLSPLERAPSIPNVNNLAVREFPEWAMRASALEWDPSVPDLNNLGPREFPEQTMENYGPVVDEQVWDAGEGYFPYSNVFSEDAVRQRRGKKRRNRGRKSKTKTMAQCSKPNSSSKKRKLSPASTKMSENQATSKISLPIDLFPEGRNEKAAECPIPGCEFKGEQLLSHAYMYHLPDFFRGRPQGKKAQIWKYICAIRWLLSHLPGPNISSKLKTLSFTGKVTEYMSKCCVALKDACGDEFHFPVELSLNPINCVALLVYWRITLHVLATLPQEAREEFCRLNAKNGATKNPSTVNSTHLEPISLSSDDKPPKPQGEEKLMHFTGLENNPASTETAKEIKKEINLQSPCKPINSSFSSNASITLKCEETSNSNITLTNSLKTSVPNPQKCKQFSNKYKGEANFEKHIEATVTNAPTPQKRIEATVTNAPNSQECIEATVTNVPNPQKRIEALNNNAPNSKKRIEALNNNAPSFQKGLEASNNNAPNSEKHTKVSNNNVPKSQKCSEASNNNAPNSQKCAEASNSNNSMNPLLLSARKIMGLW